MERFFTLVKNRRRFEHLDRVFKGNHIHPQMICDAGKDQGMDGTKECTNAKSRSESCGFLRGRAFCLLRGKGFADDRYEVHRYVEHKMRRDRDDAGV